MTGNVQGSSLLFDGWPRRDSSSVATDESTILLSKRKSSWQNCRNAAAEDFKDPAIQRRLRWTQYFLFVHFHAP